MRSRSPTAGQLADTVRPRGGAAPERPEAAVRPRALSESERNLRALLDAAPVPLTITRASDNTVIYGNRRAAALFEIPPEDIPGQRASEFWVDRAERDRFIGALLASGHVDGLEARMKSGHGRVFWARVSAQTVPFRDELCLLGGIVDITGPRQAQENLRNLLDAAPTPLVVTTLDDGVLRYCNEPARALFELPLEAGDDHAAVFDLIPADRAAFLEMLRNDGHVAGFSALLKTRSGRTFWALMNARTFVLEGEPALMIGVVDLSAQKALEERLRALATTDGLTGTFNRRHFFELGEAELRRAARYGHPTSLAMLDIDYFKTINDELGHAAGDVVLQELVEILGGEVRSSDVVARVGGEEFALLFPETGLRAAHTTAERICRAAGARSFVQHGLPPDRRITVSVGVAEHRAGETLGDLMKRADVGLYDAKSKGRDRVVVSG
jgi:diguanylate cyclase (GGDEF)-like protein/PAS domain S-box-containing protein